MILNTNFNEISIACNLDMAAKWSADVRVEHDLLPETLAYAAMRVIRKNPKLKARLVPISYKLRFAPKKNRTKHLTVQVPGEAFDLPNSTAFLKLIIRAEGISVEHLKILPSGSLAVKAAVSDIVVA